MNNWVNYGTVNKKSDDNATNRNPFQTQNLVHAL